MLPVAPSPRPSRPAIGLSLALILAGCGAQPSPPSIGSTAPTTSAARELDLPLEPGSLELVAVVGPDEVMHATVATTWTTELSTAARTAGMKVEVFEPGSSIAIDGPLGPTLELIRAVPATAVRIEDLREAMRPIPEKQPIIDVPNPGRPYLVTGFRGDLGKVAIGSPQREAMLRSLAEAIQTVDGRPYPRLDLEGGCGSDKAGPSCGLIALGFTAGSVGREDEWSLRGTAAAGWSGAIESVRTTSVPRSLLRAAEWIARHDDAAVARVRTYSGCCSVSWDPQHRGRITIVYDRLCAAVRPGRALADTGVCTDELAITVDVVAGRVVSIDGPVGT